jgi:putative multiple sugar transport system substrate-binding protein
MKRKLFSLLLAASMLTAVLAGCGQNAGNGGASQDNNQVVDNGGSDVDTPAPSVDADVKIKVGVAMPTKDLQRWNQDGANMKEQLEAAGYEVDLQYASNDVPTQVSQIENMINSGCKVLVIASIEGDSLGTVLEQAKENNIPVIAYDRLIMNSDAVTYYATFDNKLVGIKQGQYIEQQLGLASGAGPFNIELITGDPGDNNARFFFGGAMEVLQPYIDNGQLVVKSGQTSFDEVATANWSTENAQNRFDAIISAYYSDGTQLDAVMASNDSTAQGVTTSLENNYTGAWPIITGQDCDIVSVQNMIAGKQSMSIFKDTRTLAAKTVEMVDAILKGGEAPVNDKETYDNGTGIIPSYLCEPVFADINNYKELLIDSGYYTEDQLK